MSGTLALPTTGTFSGLTEQTYVNAALAALANASAGASAPSAGSTGLASTAGLFWHDTANNLLKLRDQADSTWMTLGAFDETDKVFTPYLNGAPIPAPAGFVNRLRNNSLSAWFHGTSGTVTTSGGWSAEGIYAVPAGASITWAQASSGLPAGCPTPNGLTLTGASGATDLKIRFVLESYAAAALAGKTCTFQLPIVNNTGSAIAPTIATKYPGAQDNWTSSANDLAATNLQSVNNAASGTLCYTFAVSANAVSGYEVVIDFGNNFSANTKSVTLGGGFDLRATPGWATGLQANPPAPEVRDAASDIAWNLRFFSASYDNGTAPGTATRNGIEIFTLFDDSSAKHAAASVNFEVPMRAAPTVSYWDGVGNASKLSAWQPSSWTDNISPVASFTTSTRSILWLDTGSNTPGSTGALQYQADATIIGV